MINIVEMRKFQFDEEIAKNLLREFKIKKGRYSLLDVIEVLAVPYHE